jgi:hypothetical protein
MGRPPLLCALMSAEAAEPIVCRSTPWYHKRRILMLALVWFFCAYFIYDWQIGYPEKRDIAARREALIAEKGETEGEAAFLALAKENDWKKPDHDSNYYAEKIAGEQPISAAVCGLVGLAMLYFYFRTSRGTLTADGESFTTHWGKRVPFASAFRIDRRKWEHKGLAYVYYKDAAGKEQRAIIDDLIFGGAQKVLDRLQANFKGEVIDLAKTEPEPSADSPAPSDSLPADSKPEEAEKSA